jgi:glutathione S-transferase
MDQWLCIEQNYLIPAAKKIMARGYAEMMNLPDPGPDVVDEGRRELDFALEQFAAAIAGRPFVAGDSFSLADICWRADLLRMATDPEAPWLEDRRISPWWDRVCERPAWERAQAELAAYEPRQGPPEQGGQ